MLSKQDQTVLDTLLPSGAHPLLQRGIFEAGFDRFYADFQRTAVPPFRLSFRVALWVAAWISPLLIRRLPPLSLHDRSTRERALAAMESSSVYLLRQLLSVAKTVSALAYGADPQTRSVVWSAALQPDESG